MDAAWECLFYYENELNNILSDYAGASIMISNEESVSLLELLSEETGLSLPDSAKHLFQDVLNDRLPCTIYLLGEVFRE
jgi:hypothetical protein